MRIAGVAAVAIGISVGLSAAHATQETTPAAAGKTVWDGAYTEAQAERGWKPYVEACSMCHSETLTGGPGAPGVAGPGFLVNWDGKTVGELFEYTRTTMPPGQAGSLSDQAYADLLAVILQVNAFPPGEADVPTDRAVLDTIRIAREKP